MRSLMYAFIHIPKTAGTTLRSVLRRAYGARHCDIRVPPDARDPLRMIDAKDLRRARRVYPRLAGISGHRVTPASGLETVEPDIRYFTFLREPDRRLISHLRHTFRGRLDQLTADRIRDYLSRDQHRNLQVKMLGGGDDLEGAIEALEHRVGFVGLTEAFDESFVMFHRWFGDEALEMGFDSQRVSRDKTPLPMDADELAERVADANRLDAELYRVAVERILPRQREAFGPGLDEAVARLRENNTTYHDPGEPLSGRLVRQMLYKPLLYLKL